MKKYYILLIFFFLLQNAFGQVLYTPFEHTIYKTDTYGHSVAGDLDGDGFDEWVTMEYIYGGENPSISIFDITSDGELILVQKITVPYGTTVPLLADTDHDNDLDIVVYNFEFDVSYYENNGSGEFSTTTNTFFVEPNDPFIGSVSTFNFFDFDGDGDQDFLVSTPPLHQLLENTGSDFIFKQELDLEYPVGQLVYYPVDIDGDNDLDIVTGDRDWVRVFTNVNGLLSDHQKVLWLPSSNFKQLAFGDIDNDDDIDIGYVIYNENYLTMNYNDGTDTTFTDTELLPFTSLQGSGGSDVKFIDIDNDNDLDIFIGNPGVYTQEETSGWFENKNDTLLFQLAPQPTSNTLSGWSLFSPVEIDGDSAPELIALSRGGTYGAYNRIYTLEYDNTQDSLILKYTEEDIINKITQIKTGDMDADGDIDVVTFANSSRTINWLESELPNENNTSHLIGSGVESDYNEHKIADLNGDGYPDLISVLGPFLEEKLYIYFNQPATNNFSDSILIADILAYKISVFDVDSDNDNDIVIYSEGGNYFLLKNLDGNGNFSSPTSLYQIEPTSDSGILNLDIGNDGDQDLVFYSRLDIAGTLVLELISMENDGNGNFSNPTPIHSFPGLYSSFPILETGDMNGDGFEDIIVANRNANSSSSMGILYNINGSGQFSDINYIYQNSTTNAKLYIEDIDLDGDLDIIPAYGDVQWYKNLDNSGIFSEIPSTLSSFEFIDGLADLDEDGDLDFIFRESYELVWKENTTIHKYWLEGDIIADSTLNCAADSGEFKIRDWIVIAKQEDYEIATVTDSLGHYFMPVDSGEWVINAIPKSDFWLPCFVDTVVIMPSVGDTIVTDFFMQPNGDCGYLDWTISSVNILRACQTNTRSVEICNYGVTPYEDIILEVKLDSLLYFESASHPYTVDADSTIFIEVGTLGFNECETITIDAFLDCDEAMLFDFQCIEFQLLPADLCAPTDSLWDGSIVTADGFCEGDSIFFTLENIGTSAMTTPAQFRVEIINDDIVMLFEVDDYQLDVLDQKQLSYPIQGLGMRLSADQTMNNPIANEANVIVPNCDNIANNIIFNWLPTNNGNPFVEVNCNPIFGSYDPNDKAATPIGMGPDHDIERSWELDYKIRFQNTGNDTAFLVVLRDTLSEYLDLATLNVRSGSHPFTYELNPDRELKITFANILLPDSTTNLAASQGFIDYSISPKSDAPFDSVIENKAGIYFDFNAPIITNTVFHTIRKPIVTSIDNIQTCPNGIYTMDTVLIEEFMFAEYDSMHLTYIEVYPNHEVNTTVEVPIGTILEGVPINADTTFTILYVSQNGCDSLVNFEVSILTNTISPDFQKIKIFPNPVSNLLNIIGNENTDLQNWQLVNATGQVVWEKTLHKNKAMKTISMSNFPSGVYWLEVKSKNGFGAWKIIKLE